VSAIIAMAQSLQLEVAAVGVEYQRQADFLCRQGCRRVQGFLYSPPLPASDVAPWLLQRRDGGPERAAANESAG
jgi:EAL domain-containing protein (putative c-di-GMP-specific phosphodiesterase class I)